MASASDECCDWRWIAVLSALLISLGASLYNAHELNKHSADLALSIATLTRAKRQLMEDKHLLHAQARDLNKQLSALQVDKSSLTAKSNQLAQSLTRCERDRAELQIEQKNSAEKIARNDELARRVSLLRVEREEMAATVKELKKTTLDSFSRYRESVTGMQRLDKQTEALQHQLANFGRAMAKQSASALQVIAEYQRWNASSSIRISQLRRAVTGVQPIWERARGDVSGALAAADGLMSSSNEEDGTLLARLQSSLAELRTVPCARALTGNVTTAAANASATMEALLLTMNGHQLQLRSRRRYTLARWREVRSQMDVALAAASGRIAQLAAPR